MPHSESDAHSKTLIICVDRDDDVGVKTGIKSPIIGKDACLNAATKLALADPEEADANSIFAAVQQYDTLLGKGEDCEVVVAAGLYQKGINADKKIRKEISDVLRGYPANEAVLVSDGIEGEEIAPIIQNLVPIVSIRRVVVKHSRSVEETYAVLGRYLRQLLFDPRYSRSALGIPGLILVGLAIVLAVAAQYAGVAFLTLIAVALIVRGFDVDKRIGALRDLPVTSYLRFLPIMASILIVIFGIVLGIDQFFATCTNSVLCPAYYVGQSAIKSPEQFILVLPQLAGYFIQAAQILIWLGIGIYITSSLFFEILTPEARHATRDIVALVVLGLLYFPVAYLGNTLLKGPNSINLSVAIVLFAVAVNFVLAAYVYSRISRRRSQSGALEVEGSSLDKRDSSQ
jgi:putative membrane protein